MMTKITINRAVEAEQWLGEGHPLPEKVILCRPEVHWGAGRKLVYFTYADLLPRHWIDATENEYPAPDKFEFMCHGIAVQLRDGRKYWRQVYPFSCWNVKSEASIKRNYTAVYLEKNDEPLVRAFVDFLDVEGWTNPLPPRAEFRIVDGAYGRGFKPVYLKPGDWLVREPGKEPCVVTSEEFDKLRAA
jgi:hypothetical protein